MATVEARDGVEIYAEAHGEGIPLIISCALCTTSENWRGQVEPLVAAGARVILWDLRGHGRSGVPRDAAAYHLDQVVDDLARVLDWAAPGQPAVLAGHSFGGLASLHFAARHQERVLGLLLVASGPGFKNPEAAQRWADQVERTASFLEERGLEAFVQGRAGETCIGRRPESPAAQAAAAAIKAQDPAGLARFGRYVSGPAAPVIDALPGIDRPALILVGEHDQAFLRAAEVMEAKLPDARREVIPGAGHVVNLEDPETFNAHAVGFVARLAALKR